MDLVLTKKEKRTAYQKAYHRAYHINNKDKVAAYQRSYHRNNKEKVSSRQKAYRLLDSSIRTVMCRNSCLEPKDIPQSIVDLKREQIKLIRLKRAMK